MGLIHHHGFVFFFACVAVLDCGCLNSININFLEGWSSAETLYWMLISLLFKECSPSYSLCMLIGEALQDPPHGSCVIHWAGFWKQKFRVSPFLILTTLRTSFVSACERLIRIKVNTLTSRLRDSLHYLALRFLSVVILSTQLHCSHFLW